MAKRNSEGQVRESLKAADLSLQVYKPPDDARNWKPCDFMVWFLEREPGQASPCPSPHSAWLEIKDTDSVALFALSELRTAQRAGIRDAEALGIPYYLLIWWRRHEDWTITRALPILTKYGRLSVPRAELLVAGVGSTNRTLPSILRSVLLGELD